MQTAWWEMKPRQWLARGVNLLGEAYHGQGQYGLAEQTFMNVLDYDPNALQISRALLHVDMRRYNLIALYEAWNKPEEAGRWRTILPKTEAVTE